MTELYEANFKQVSKYVHATSRGHEAIQIATGMQLLPQDYACSHIIGMMQCSLSVGYETLRI